MSRSLRKHQAELDAIATNILDGEYVKHILAHVTPGGGKSALPVILANRLIPDLPHLLGDQAVATHICWLVNRQSLQDQAEQAFSSPDFQRLLGSMRQIRSADNLPDPSRGRNGYVVTYNKVANAPDLHLHEFQRPGRRYILVLDECHHLSDDEHADWRRAVAPLVDAAALVLYMTGTPMRNDGKPLAFLPYREEGGKRVLAADTADGWKLIRYNRTAALNERAIVPIRIRWIDGHVEYEKAGTGSVTASSFDVLDEESVSDGIHVAINTDYALGVLDMAAREWLAYRSENPWSRLLIVAGYQDLAKRYCEYLKDRHGINAGIAVSRRDDGKQNRDVIASFRDRGRPEALVTVAIAYEGLDVPGITHIVALTHYRSAPWLEQMLARGVRVVAGVPWEEQFCAAYVMDDARMRDAVRVIQEEQVAAIGPDRGAEEELVAGGEPVEMDREQLSQSDVIPLFGAATASRESDMRGRSLSREDTARFERVLQLTGKAGKLSPVDLAELIRVYENDREPDFNRTRGGTVTDREREASLRSKIQGLGVRYDRLRGVAPGTFNAEEKRRTGLSIEQRTLEQLRETYAHIDRLLQAMDAA